MKHLAVITLVSVVGMGSALAANLSSPAAMQTYDSLSPDARQVADGTVRSAPDLPAYCATSVDQKRDQVATFAKSMVMQHEIPLGSVTNVVGETLKYAAVACNSN